MNIRLKHIDFRTLFSLLLFGSFANIVMSQTEHMSQTTVFSGGAYTTTIYDTACDSRSFNGKTFTSSTGEPYKFTRKYGSTGKDEHVVYNVVIYKTSSKTTSIDVCDSYTWNYTSGKSETYTVSGTYNKTLKGAIKNICDSIKTLELTIRKSTQSQFNPGPQCDEYYWPNNNMTYTESTTDVAHLSNRVNCDSAVTLLLVVNYSSSYEYSLTQCDQYTWHGTTYTRSDNPIYHSTNAVGCDSTTTLHLRINYSTSSSITENVCDNYTWNPFGRTYSASTTDQVSLQNAVGCDSVITLNLTVRHSSSKTVGESIVQNQLPYTYNGYTYTDLSGANNQTVIVPNSVGCDSIITYGLTIYPNVTAEACSTVCQNVLESQSGFRWNGQTFRSEGQQNAILVAHTGADSLLKMTVVMAPSYAISREEAICDNETYDFYGTICKKAQKYTKKFTTVSGCDSIITLTLKVNPTYNITQRPTICNNNPYSYCNGMSAVEEGRYSCVLPSVHGCDSNVLVILSVKDTSEGEAFDTIVQNQLPKTYYDQVFTAKDVYGTGDGYRVARYAKGNINRCDSVIKYHLFVYRNDTVRVDSSICATDLPFTWNGQRFTSVGTKEYKTRNIHGADSLVIMTLHTIQNPTRTIYDTILENYLPDTIYQGTPYKKVFNDEVKNYRIQIENEGCDSIVIYNLAVKRNSSTVIDTQICYNHFPLDWHGFTFNSIGRNFRTITASTGADSVLVYKVDTLPHYDYVLPVTICENESYTFNGAKLSTAGTYRNEAVTARYGCDSIVTLKLTVNAVTYGAEYDTVVQNRLSDQHGSWWYGYYYGYYHNGIYFRDGSCNLAYQNPSYTIPHWGEVTDYTIKLKNVKGCDSLLSYNLHVWWNRDTNVYDTVCGQELPYTWTTAGYTTTFNANAFGGNPKQGGSSQRIKILTTHGADSNIVFNLFVHPTWHVVEDSVVCENRMKEDYQWHDTTLLANSVAVGVHQYISDSTSRFGCDSVRTLNLTVYGNSSSTIYDTIVENQTLVEGCYVFNGVPFCDKTTIVDSTIIIRNAKRCDSVIVYNLYVHPNVTGSDDSVICADQLPWIWNNAEFVSDSLPDELLEGKSKSGVIAMKGTILAHTGADSVVSMLLTVNPTYDYHRFDTICDDTVAFFFGNVYTETGTDIRHINSSLQCDSVWTFHLQKYPTFEYDRYDTIFENQWSYFAGHAYNIDSTYVDSLLSVHQCDSVWYMHLVVNRLVNLDSSVCNNTLPLVWNHVSFFESSVDSVLLRTSNGLRDSMVIMTVTVRDTSWSNDVQEHCDTFTWRNDSTYLFSTISESVRLRNAVNCDSVIHLRLTVNHATPATHHHNECNTFTWLNGVTYDASISGPQYMLRTTKGCDSLVTLDLSLFYNTYDEILDSMCEGMGYIFRGRGLASGGTYYDSLQTVHGCDSITVLFLTELPSANNVLVSHANCSELFHEISLSTDMKYYKWSATPEDPSLVGQEFEDTIIVSPKVTTTYVLYSDYRYDALCPSSKSITLNPIVNPKAMLKTTPEYFSYDDLLLEAMDMNPNVYARYWYVDGVMQGEVGPSLRYTVNPVSDTVSVALEVYTDYCRDTAYAKIPILKPVLFVPNAFTPGESSNNRFMVKSSQIDGFEMFIYNRRGQLVFHTTDINEGWDGRFDGEICPQGAYVYRLHYQTSIVTKAWQYETGTVLLIR
ncbi:MAG: gliding motility-associated C-terminal domain-containing protein [Bacteroidales bacterium]|nr:gliding motility-associated C-terminal domain-containing protein [Candidatus Colimorpha onthohippi]